AARPEGRACRAGAELCPRGVGNRMRRRKRNRSHPPRAPSDAKGDGRYSVGTMRAMPKATPPRLRLLRCLAAEKGGCLPAESLTVPDRRLATRMQSDGFVQWRAPGISSRHTCLGQTLFI